MLSDIIGNGGFILSCIGIASLVALGVAFERIARLSRWQKEFRSTWDLLQTQLEKREIRQKELPSSNALGRVLQAGMRNARLGEESIRNATFDAAQQEVSQLERGLGALSTVAQVAPLLGLLGTVAGLMEAFQAAQAAESITAELLANGIFKALGTTAAGLGVAIPAYIAYNSLSAWTTRLIDSLEHAAGELPRIVARSQG